MLLTQHLEHALHAQRPATTVGVAAAEHADQWIVATTAANGQPIGHPFEHRQVVVIEAAHQTWIDFERQVLAFEQGLQLLEVSHRFLTEVTDQLWRVFDQLLHLGVLGIENAQRIAVQPTPRIGVEQ